MTLLGCASPLELPRQVDAAAGWRTGGVQAGPWWVSTAERGGKGEMVHIYIEGDGHAYITAGQPSGNPTPKMPVALDLAKLDRADVPVVYLARPCQYAELKSQPCTAATWTTGRFTEEVMSAYAEAVRKLLAGRPNPALDGAQVAGKHAVLIGYSGGAAIALEVAKRLPEVAGVITVAGNIDPAATNAWHKVSALPEAVRPYQYPGRLAQIPVLHLVGERDMVINPALTRQVLDGAGQLACTKVQVVPGADHNTGWQAAWPVDLPHCN